MDRRSKTRQMAESAILVLMARAGQAIMPAIALWMLSTVHSLELAAEDVKVKMLSMETSVSQLEKKVFGLQ